MPRRRDASCVDSHSMSEEAMGTTVARAQSSCSLMGLRGPGGTMEIERHRGLPGGRAVLGGVLMAAAAVGVYLAYDQASARPTEPVVVAAHALRVGEVLAADDLETIEADLPGGAGDATFATVEAVT